MAWEIRNDINRAKYLITTNNKCGLSLIAVLWMVTILTVLASEFMYSLQLEVRTSRNWNDQVSTYYAAKGGFETAIANLRVDETGYDSLDEDWAQGYTGELNNCSFDTKVIDESSRININTADEATLQKVIQYCLTSQQSTNSEELSESEVTTQAQTLASAIVAKRPYRTTAEMAKAEGMTPELLYGYTGESTNNQNNQGTNHVNTNTNTNTDNTSTDEEQKIIPLVDVTTVFSLDKNVSSDGQKRINIDSADANQIQQGVNPQGQGQQQVITQQEAQAIVDYRSQSNNNQSGQNNTGTQTQNTTGGQTTTTDQTQQSANQTYKSITDLLNVPAISQQTLDSIRNNIDIQDSQQGGQQGGQQDGQNQQQQKININSASADQLRSLSDRIDDGIANDIINYRQNNRFNSVDDLLQVKAISIQDLRTIIDKVTTTDDATLQGKININTVPLEILEILPGMDEQKANAIIAYREEGTSLAGTTNTQSISQSQAGQQQGGPFDNSGKLMDVQGIDENTFRQLVDIITYRTYTFRIESTGKSQDEKIVNGFTAIIDRSGDSIKIKYWKQ